MSELVLTEVADQIATITLNRPEARNALSGALLKDLVAAVRDAQADDAVSVIILTGADPAFCAGLDLKELGAGSGTLTGTRPRDDTPVDKRGPLPPGPKPVIGAINGAAITGGFELALACDFLIASDRARFADTHARVGIQPWWGLTVLLPQAIGLRRAREMSATGNFCDAQKALDWGLVNHVVPHDDLLPFARGIAADIVSSDQRAVRQIFATYAAGSRVTVGDAWLVESDVAAEWQGKGLDPEEIERRRQGVTDRGRTQL
ncbi:enoyl-CoA hydratase [Aquihabitans daechungensis]|uniref:enoyl-CoA hydratase n=1 Tax=Aquihabitans daechungensis TaxID=1052257 RepID=UPI003B9EE0C5